MSYSFSLKAATKAAAAAAAAAKFDEMLTTQPVHKADRAAALANLQAHLDLVREPGDTDEVSVSMHGSITGVFDQETHEATSLSTAGSGCSVSVWAKS